MRKISALLALSLLMPGIAMAQGRLGPASRPESTGQPRERPPGLPGLQSRPSQVIPPTNAPSGMNPTDALFDAISRGDVPAAREAVSRGADTNARNALGLTAADSAVDQGRPDMIFYLLSLRGSAGSAPPPPGAGREGLPVSNRPGRREAAARQAANAPAPNAPATGPAPATARTARLFANDGGAPQPDAGFLGFDAGRQGGAAPLTGRVAPARAESRGRAARS